MPDRQQATHQAVLMRTTWSRLHRTLQTLAPLSAAGAGVLDGVSGSTVVVESVWLSVELCKHTSSFRVASGTWQRHVIDGNFERTMTLRRAREISAICASNSAGEASSPSCLEIMFLRPQRIIQVRMTLKTAFER